MREPLWRYLPAVPRCDRRRHRHPEGVRTRAASLGGDAIPAGDEPAWSVNQPAARPRPSACGGVRTDVERWRGGLPPPRLAHRRRWPSHRAAASLRGRRHRPRTPTPSSRVGLSVPTLSSGEPARAPANLRNQAESGGIPASTLPAAPERSAPRSSAVLVEPRWRTPPVTGYPSNWRAPTTIPAMLTRAPTIAGPAVNAPYSQAPGNVRPDDQTRSRLLGSCRASRRHFYRTESPPSSVAVLSVGRGRAAGCGARRAPAHGEGHVRRADRCG